MDSGERHEHAKRIACVDLPELPMQIVLRDHLEWRKGPVCVVAEDRPEATLVHVNEHARERRLRSGLRYGAALNLVPELRASVVSSDRVAQEVEGLCRALLAFSPRVEPDRDRPGVFYLDPEGLARLYGTLENWANSVLLYLRGRSYQAAVVVGFGRFPSLAIARTHADVLVLESRAECAALVAQVPLDRLGITPRLLSDLAALAVRTVGDLVALPATTLHTRFGEEASRLHRLASEDPQLPIHDWDPNEPVEVSFEVDPPDNDRTRLLFGIKGALHKLLRHVIARVEALTAIRIELTLDEPGAPVVTERIEMAAPTRDAVMVLDLIRLRLEAIELTACVDQVLLIAESIRSVDEQLALFVTPSIDVNAGNRALARLRAAFGSRSVTRARLRAAHLPEARFRWDETRALVAPRNAAFDAERDEPTLIRRVLPRPRVLALREDGNPSAGPSLGAEAEIVTSFGPYRISGGWWVRHVERDYFYAETSRGELLWIYFDRPRQKWFLHGYVD